MAKKGERKNNNRKTTRGRKRQTVMSAPAKILDYETVIGRDENGEDIVKRVYKKNPAKIFPVKAIIHV